MPKYQFDKWKDLYATRTGALRSSAIRDLLAVTARSDIISLAGGLPYTRDFRMDKVVAAVRATMEKDGNAALQYGPSEGHIGLKTHIVELMALDGVKVDPEDLIVTDGSQQALDLIAKIFVDPGEVILVEAPSYLGALNAFLAYQPEVVSVPLDEDGLRVDLLAETLRRLKKQGKKPKFLYTVPNFHNPAGVTLSLERRHKLLDLAKSEGLLIIEDDAYGRLRFEGSHIPPLRALDENVVYLGTFSKILAAGLRLGWVSAPTPILEKLIFAKQAADLCTSSFGQYFVDHFFHANSVGEYIAALIDTYRRRRDRMAEALEEFFPPEAKWTLPHGGFFIWAELPEFMDTTAMLAEAINRKVAYVPGAAFFADGSGKNFMRLAYCYPHEDDVYEGIRRLALVVKDQLDLYHSLASGGRKKKPRRARDSGPVY